MITPKGINNKAIMNAKKKHRIEMPENFTQFCSSKNCPEFIIWDFGYDDCYSCHLVGQSYNVEEYPPDCLFIDEIKKYKCNCNKLAQMPEITAERHKYLNQ